MSVTAIHPVAKQSSAPTAREVLKLAAERTLAYDFTVWFWGDAIAIDGLLEAAELLGDPSYSDFCLEYFHRWSRQTLSWADHLTPGGALVKLASRSHDQHLLHASERLADWLLFKTPRASRTGFPLYRPDLPPYRHTVWVDTIYHEPRFFCELAAVTTKTEYFQSALHIWNAHVKALSSRRGPFLAHAFDTGASLHRGYGWGRGNGWALFGMIDALELLPRHHSGYAAALENFQQLSSAVLRLQDPSGFWRTLLQDRDSYLESSTAAFFGAAFAKGVRLGLLSAEYARASELAWRATLSRIDAEGGFYGVSACTYAAVSPGDDTSMYHTLPTEVNVWGQGSALRFAAERIRSNLA
ncbi:MAG: glycoside hydrolase family 88 protein [Verrucomicrobia bacterium]|nr:glycoside hydrolase family 88 protein [Verrucomicrobiota bacterium]